MEQDWFLREDHRRLAMGLSLGFAPQLCPGLVPVLYLSTTKSILPEILPILLTFSSVPPFFKGKKYALILLVTLPLAEEQSSLNDSIYRLFFLQSPPRNSKFPYHYNWSFVYPAAIAQMGRFSQYSRWVFLVFGFCFFSFWLAFWVIFFYSMSFN